MILSIKIARGPLWFLMITTALAPLAKADDDPCRISWGRLKLPDVLDGIRSISSGSEKARRAIAVIDNSVADFTLAQAKALAVAAQDLNAAKYIMEKFVNFHMKLELGNRLTPTEAIEAGAAAHDLETNRRIMVKYLDENIADIYLSQAKALAAAAHDLKAAKYMMEKFADFHMKSDIPSRLTTSEIIEAGAAAHDFETNKRIVVKYFDENIANIRLGETKALSVATHDVESKKYIIEKFITANMKPDAPNHLTAPEVIDAARAAHDFALNIKILKSYFNENIKFLSLTEVKILGDAVHDSATKQYMLSKFLNANEVP